MKAVPFAKAIVSINVKKRTKTTHKKVKEALKLLHHNSANRLRIITPKTRKCY